MTTEIGYAVRLVLLAALAGLLVRRRVGECWSFLLYVLAIVVTGQMQASWPDRYFNYPYYLRFQAVWNVLKFATALELAARIFGRFPRALARVRLLAFVVLALTTGLALAPPLDLEVRRLILGWEPRTQAAALWLMTLVSLLVVWYRLPIATFQRAILLGFVPYLAVFGTLLSILRSLDVTHGWPFDIVNIVDGSAYLAVCVWWAYSAWRAPAPPLASRAEA